MPKTEGTFLVIDANSLIHRAYHALPPLTTSQGVLVNAVYGFSSILLKMLREMKPAFIAACFDLKGPTFRDEMYEEYKAGREEKPQEFYDQFDMIKEVLAALHVRIVEQEGYEADDIIGTLVRRAQKEARSIIVSGDKDMLQLVADAVEVALVKKGVSETVVYTPQRVREEFGFGHTLLPDYKALRGDPSDNIPGVAGIGEKTARELVRAFGTLEEIYAALSRGDSRWERVPRAERVKSLLRSHKKEAVLSKKLVRINCSVPVRFSLGNARWDGGSYEDTTGLLRRYGFRSLLARVPKPETKSLWEHGSSKGEGARAKAPRSYALIDTPDLFSSFARDLERQRVFALDTETASVRVPDARLLGIAFSWKPGTGYYVPQEIVAQNRSFFERVLGSETIQKVGHNMKFDYAVLHQEGIAVRGIAFDSMVASYMMQPGSRSHALDTLAFAEFGHRMIPIEKLIGAKGKGQKSMADADPREVAEYAAEDADFTFRLFKKLSQSPRLRASQNVFQKIEMPLIPVLAEMECAGIKVDVAHLRGLSREFEKKISSLKKRIIKQAGVSFNPASPQQLKEILFERLGIPSKGIGRTKTGISTAASELEKIKGAHPIVADVLRFRELSKLKNTYTDALPRLVHPRTGRVHTSFNQTVTATGRLSSSDPNLQNIPIRTPEGERIRAAFVAERGWRLICADYSQFELRIIASLAGDERMIEAFRKGEDIHRMTAAEVGGIAPEEVTDTQRREAKEVNFGILYGLGPRGMARRAGIPLDRAKRFYDAYFKLHPQIQAFIEQKKKEAHSNGYVETLFGRRRYFPEIQTEHPALRAQAERAAVNLPVQGTQADLIKCAMIRVRDEIYRRQWEDRARMILQVHDELVFEVRTGIAAEAMRVFKEIMEQVYPLAVPIVVHMGIGRNWSECK